MRVKGELRVEGKDTKKENYSYKSTNPKSSYCRETEVEEIHIH